MKKPKPKRAKQVNAVEGQVHASGADKQGQPSGTKIIRKKMPSKKVSVIVVSVCVVSVYNPSVY